MYIAETGLCIVQQLNYNRFSINLLKKKQISEKKKCIWTINYDSLNKNTISLKLHNRTEK